ncbi:MAG: serine hydrolase [Acidobacteria bacterium]|nr:MAG: serine hydrolase [Acidobacteriota bacterium]
MMTVMSKSSRRLSVIVCILALSSISAWPQVPKPTPTTGTSTVPERPAQSTPEITASDVESFLDGLVPAQLQREDIAGAVIVVVKDGKVLVSKGYGYADVQKRTPVSPDATLFRPGSISKTFTWTAVMQLVEQGKLDLDRDINDYLDFQVPHTFGRPVTLRNLMTHTAGFEEVIKDLMVDRADDLPSLQAFIKTHEPKQIYAPGTIPAYSNYGADLAGYIVQHVSGVPFEQYIQRNVFGPLGMTRATFVQPLPDSLKPMMSNGYAVASDDAKPFELVPPEPAPDGSLSVTGENMARFMIAHLQNGRYGDTRILQQQSAEMMHARQFGMDPAVNGMAFGFYEESRNGLRIIGHGGDLSYFHSDMHLVLEKGLGFFVSYNSTGKGELDPRSGLWQEFLNRYFPFSEPPTGAAEKKPVEAILGKYLSSRRAQTTIMKSLWLVLAEPSVSQAEDGTIQVDSMKDFAGQPKHWHQVGGMKFREDNGQELLVFKPDASGRMQMFTEDPIEIYQRVGWTENKTVWSMALGFVTLVFGLTLLLWPVAALLRHHYNRPLALSSSQRRLRLLVKLSCAIELAALIAFAAILVYGFSNLSLFNERLDPWLRCLQVLFVIGLIDAIAMIYACFRLWRTSSRGIWTTIYSAGLVLASLVFIWIVVSGSIVQLSLKY